MSVALLASLLFVCVPTRTHDKKQNDARVGEKQQSWLFTFMWQFISTFLWGGGGGGVWRDFAHGKIYVAAFSRFFKKKKKELDFSH